MNNYYSSHDFSSVNKVETELVKIYPNPVSDYLSISIPDNNAQITFELIDIQGRKILTKEISNSETISMEDLNKVVYFYNLVDSNNKQSGRLIKN